MLTPTVLLIRLRRVKENLSRVPNEFLLLPVPSKAEGLALPALLVQSDLW